MTAEFAYTIEDLNEAAAAHARGNQARTPGARGDAAGLILIVGLLAAVVAFFMLPRLLEMIGVAPTVSRALAVPAAAVFMVGAVAMIVRSTMRPAPQRPVEQRVRRGASRVPTSASGGLDRRRNHRSGNRVARVRQELHANDSAD